MKARIKEFNYEKCPVCGLRLHPDDRIDSTLEVEGLAKISFGYHKRCADILKYLIRNGAAVTYDSMSHRILI